MSKTEGALLSVCNVARVKSLFTGTPHDKSWMDYTGTGPKLWNKKRRIGIATEIKYIEFESVFPKE